MHHQNERDSVIKELYTEFDRISVSDQDQIPREDPSRGIIARQNSFRRALLKITSHLEGSPGNSSGNRTRKIKSVIRHESAWDENNHGHYKAVCRGVRHASPGSFSSSERHIPNLPPAQQGLGKYDSTGGSSRLSHGSLMQVRERGFVIPDYAYLSRTLPNTRLSSEDPAFPDSPLDEPTSPYREAAMTLRSFNSSFSGVKRNKGKRSPKKLIPLPFLRHKSIRSQPSVRETNKKSNRFGSWNDKAAILNSRLKIQNVGSFQYLQSDPYLSRVKQLLDAHRHPARLIRQPRYEQLLDNERLARIQKQFC